MGLYVACIKLMKQTLCVQTSSFTYITLTSWLSYGLSERKKKQHVISGCALKTHLHLYIIVKDIQQILQSLS